MARLLSQGLVAALEDVRVRAEVDPRRAAAEGAAAALARVEQDEKTRESERLVRVQRMRGTQARLEREAVTADAALRRFEYEVERRLFRAPILDVEEIKNVPYAPPSHPFLERLIGTIRRECLARARATGIAWIQNFESRLQGDILAVAAAVAEPWSKAVEGQVNRLKTIKRQMYGRAGVELLRTRLIPLSP